MERYKVPCSLSLEIFRQRLDDLSEKLQKEFLALGRRLELIISKLCSFLELDTFRCNPSFLAHCF